MRPILIRWMAGLLATCSTMVANAQGNASAAVSITVTNQGDQDLHLEVHEILRPPVRSAVTLRSSISNQPPRLPPRPLAEFQTNRIQSPLSKQVTGKPSHATAVAGQSSISNQPPRIPPRPVKLDGGRSPLNKQVTVKPSQATVLEMVPGQYHLNIVPRVIRHKPPPTFFVGFISITNSETWIFKLEPKAQEIELQTAGQFWEWNLEVPSRPGFRLSSSPEPGILPLPPRPERFGVESPALPPRPLRPAGALPSEADVLIESARRFSTNSPR